MVAHQYTSELGKGPELFKTNKSHLKLLDVYLSTSLITFENPFTDAFKILTRRDANACKGKSK